MALTGAQRQARRRAHARGDHSQCDPERDCHGERDVLTRDPTGLQARGRKLWRDTLAGQALDPSQLVLLEEACRLADRLDRLDALLRGEDREWFQLSSLNDDGPVVRVVIDKALSESRQQQSVLKLVMAELRQSGLKAPSSLVPATPKPAVDTPNVGGGGVPHGISDLTARIAARRADSAG